MPRFLFLLSFLIALSFLTVACRQKTENNMVGVSIKPLHSLVSSLLQDTGVTARLIIPGNKSVHRFHLKPSQARILNRARVVIRFSHDLETFITPRAKSHPDKVITVTDFNDLPFLYSRGKNFKDQHHKNSDHDSQNHSHTRHHEHTHSHNSGRPDPHLWLDPLMMQQVVEKLAEKLSIIWPEKKTLIDKNLAHLKASLKKLDETLKAKLVKLANSPFHYMVYHDAYRYLERRYGLKHHGIIRTNLHGNISARHLSRLLKKISTQNIKCLFVEKQTKGKLTRLLTQKSKIESIVIDPAGSFIPAGIPHYQKLMIQIADRFESCLNSGNTKK